jgi:hypothetical protein
VALVDRVIVAQIHKPQRCRLQSTTAAIRRVSASEKRDNGI